VNDKLSRLCVHSGSLRLSSVAHTESSSAIWNSWEYWQHLHQAKR